MATAATAKGAETGATVTVEPNGIVNAATSPANDDPKIILPLKTGLLPPTPTPTLTSQRLVRPVYMPSRMHCLRYVVRFFDEVHCLYWFYSPEHFYTQLDYTLETAAACSASASWLCALYAVFAMGSMWPAGTAAEGPVPDAKKTADYLALAKELSPAAADEADMESVRAFGLLVCSLPRLFHLLSPLTLPTGPRHARNLL